MPIPKPRQNEPDDEFLNRCMGDKVMVSEFPDSKQRYAVCNDQLKINNVDNVKNRIGDDMARETATEKESNYGFSVVGKGKRHIIAGYGSYIMIDSDDQLVTPEALKGGLNKFMADKERRNIMFSHEGIQIGKVIDSYKDHKTHVDDAGLYIVGEIYDDLQTSKDVWQGILDGEFNAYSISFEPLHKASHVVDDGNSWEEVKEINLLEVSVCQNPKNPLSRFMVLSKSSNVKEKNKGEEMTKENNAPTPDENDEGSEESEKLDEQEPKKPEKSDDDDEDDSESSKDNELVGTIRTELNRLSGLGDKIRAEDLSPLAKLVTTLRTGGQKMYPFPEKANKSEDDDWHTVVANAIDDIYSRLDAPVKSETKSKETIRQLKAEVVRKAEEADGAKKDVEEANKNVEAAKADADKAKSDAVAAKEDAEEAKKLAEQDREVITELKGSLDKVNETFSNFDNRLKNLESQKEVKTKVSTDALIDDYHPSNVRESPDGVEILIEGDE